jgi:hypothetical protein
LLAPYDTAREGVWRQGGQHVHKDATWVGRSTGQQKSWTRGVDRKGPWSAAYGHQLTHMPGRSQHAGEAHRGYTVYTAQITPYIVYTVF